MALATVTFQSNDRADIFHQIVLPSIDLGVSDGTLAGLETVNVDGDDPWITGSVPRFHPVNIEGDTMLIQAWFRGERFDGPYRLRVYVEYEETEELIDVVAEEQSDEDKRWACLQPQEIHL